MKLITIAIWRMSCEALGWMVGICLGIPLAVVALALFFILFLVYSAVVRIAAAVAGRHPDDDEPVIPELAMFGGE